MNTKVMFSSESAEWGTPQWLFNQLNKEFNFTLDVAATAANAKCANYFTPEDDCLKQSWYGRCWMNPPYGDPEYPCKANCSKKKRQKRGFHISNYVPGIADFLAKAFTESQKISRLNWW